MKIIVGLGNPGKQYEKTRHNLGFIIADALREIWKFENWREDKKNNSLVAEGKVGKEKIYLLKPQTFMNASGSAIAKFISYHKKISSDNILVIHDELDLPWKKIKIENGRGSAGHKGVQSIIESLDTKDFSRMRVGIKQESTKTIKAENFVLDKLSDGELGVLPDIISEAKTKAEEFIKKKQKAP